MKAKLKQYIDRLDAMSLRERVLIFLMLAAVMVALIFTMAIDPLIAKQKVLSQNLAQTQAQTQAMEAQIQALAEASKLDPDAANKQRLAQLQFQREAAYTDLAVMQKGLVSADKMTQLLRDLLGKNPRLKLVSMKTIPATPLLDSAKSPDKSSDKSLEKPVLANPTSKAEANAVATPAPTPPPTRVAQLGLYKHAVEITVDGSYADLLAYLNELEHMPWHVYWGGVSLSARDAPVSRLTLVVYTLSLDKTWLAV